MHICLTYALFALTASSSTVSQTSWAGSGGVPGPVACWGTDYWTDTLLTVGDSSIMLTTCYEPLRHILSSDEVDCLTAADFDGDGDLDLAAADIDSGLEWWENLQGTGLQWEQHPIGSEAGFCWIDAADIDDDGDIDLAASHTGLELSGFFWLENMGSGGSWTVHSVADGFSDPFRVLAEDMDNDGDIDLVGTCLDEDRIPLFLNEGAGGSWITEWIDQDNGGWYLCTGDIDSDGWMDLVVALDNEIRWYANSTGSWNGNIVASGGEWDLQSIATGDINGNGEPDIICAGSSRRVMWYDNSGGSGTAWTGNFMPYCQPTGAISAVCGDIDGDGNPDVAAGFGPGGTVEYWSNVNGNGMVWTHHLMDGEVLPASLLLADLDGDGFEDPAACCSEGLMWWDAVWEPLEGELVSSILQIWTNPSWEMMQWSCEAALGSRIAFQIRSSDDPGDMGTWSDTIFTAGDISPILDDGDRYLQYKVIMQRIDETTIPSLDSVEFTFSQIHAYQGEGYHLFGVRPNPVIFNEYFLSSLVMFHSPLPGSLQFEVYDSAGRLLERKEFDDWVVEGMNGLLLSDDPGSIGYSTGVYYYRISSGEWEDFGKFLLVPE